MISGAVRVPGSESSRALLAGYRPGRADAIPFPGWRGARDRTLAALLSGAKCLIVTGPPGTGKTLLLQDVARILRSAGWDATVQLHAAFPLSVIEAVTTMTRPRVIMIDEADRFDPNELRSTLDANGQTTVLAGLDSLGDRFPECARTTLAPLTHDEGVAFISQWLIQAGHSPTLLSNAAVVRAADLSQGIPRLLANTLRGALWLADTQGTKTVTKANIEDAANLQGCLVRLAEPDGSAVMADVATTSDQPCLLTGTNDLYRAIAENAHKQPIPALNPIRAHIAEPASEPDTRDSSATLQRASAPTGLPPITPLRSLRRLVGVSTLAAACIAAGALLIMFPFGDPGRVGILRSPPSVTVEPFAPVTAGVSLVPAQVTPALSDCIQPVASPSASTPERSEPTSRAGLTTAAPEIPHLATASGPFSFDNVDQPCAATNLQRSHDGGEARTNAPSPPHSSALFASGSSQADAGSVDTTPVVAAHPKQSALGSDDVTPVSLLASDTPSKSIFAMVPGGGENVHSDALLRSAPTVAAASLDPVTPVMSEAAPGSLPNTTQRSVPDSLSALPSPLMLPVAESDQPLPSLHSTPSTLAIPMPGRGRHVSAAPISFAPQPSDQNVVAAETADLPSVSTLETGLFAAGNARPADVLPKTGQEIPASASDPATLGAGELSTAPALISDLVSSPTDLGRSVPVASAAAASTQESRPSNPDAPPVDAAAPVPDTFRTLDHKALLVPADAISPDTGKAAAAAASRMPLTLALPQAMLDSLIERGDQAIRVGDVSAARLLYGRAALSRGEAAASMGRTFDRAFLTQIGASISPDQATAAEWYRRAIALGNKEAVALLQRLE